MSSSITESDRPLPDAADPTGERALLVAFLGDLRGRAVLDVGCGDPALTAHVLRSGAHSYAGVAPDEERADAVRRLLDPGVGHVQVRDLNRWSGRDDSPRVDVVLSRYALHQVRNLPRLLAAVQHDLVPGGRLVFSVPHPMATAVVGSAHGRGWLRTADYFREGERPATDALPGPPPVHRTLETYLRELRLCGLRLDEFSEGLAGMDHSAGPCGPGDGPRWAVFRCVRT
ncbi:class I SAM-dependent methyltransferase [Micromonospora auratinigra]|uniref:Methyltransferase domain-containing protein n=1 Tax=Micromonospora auratinigra TaxID=261654 RepID=A0A1A8ZGX7_9ACTN|nr:class I SAM-dependent methyltransferase [Micromonospora auratinigra]SBT43093.1 Methyltransferase domain-containing protein [Micromonospora auratinigra]